MRLFSFVSSPDAPAPLLRPAPRLPACGLRSRALGLALGLALAGVGCAGAAKDSGPSGADGASDGGSDGALDGVGDGASDGASDGGDGGGAERVEATLGASCAEERRIGRVTLMGWGGDSPLSLDGTVLEAPHPWSQAPALEGGGCAFHTFDAAACGPCPGGTICAADGACVEEPRTRKDVQVEVIRDGATERFEADPTTGALYGTLGAVTARASLRVQWAGVEIIGPEMNVPDGGIVEPRVRFEGEADRPGAMTVAWSPRGDGSQVGTLIHINHHAAGPTFTTCRVPESDGGFGATAAMIDPLAVSTGLEFQGLDHMQTAAAELEGGCVELRVMSRVFAR
jgi:hypothetical protein